MIIYCVCSLNRSIHNNIQISTAKHLNRDAYETIGKTDRLCSRKLVETYKIKAYGKIIISKIELLLPKCSSKRAPVFYVNQQRYVLCVLKTRVRNPVTILKVPPGSPPRGRSGQLDAPASSSPRRPPRMSLPGEPLGPGCSRSTVAPAQ